MLFALKEICVAAKSSAFTVGCLRTLFYIKMLKDAKSRKLECTLDVFMLQHYYYLFLIFFSLIDLYL